MNPISANFQVEKRHNDYLPNCLDEEVIAAQKRFYNEILPTTLMSMANSGMYLIFVRFTVSCWNLGVFCWYSWKTKLTIW